jgi:hypothetical protein
MPETIRPRTSVPTITSTTSKDAALDIKIECLKENVNALMYGLWEYKRALKALKYTDKDIDKDTEQLEEMCDFIKRVFMNSLKQQDMQNMLKTVISKLLPENATEYIINITSHLLGHGSISNKVKNYVYRDWLAHLKGIKYKILAPPSSLAVDYKMAQLIRASSGTEDGASIIRNWSSGAQKWWDYHIKRLSKKCKGDGDTSTINRMLERKIENERAGSWTPFWP